MTHISLNRCISFGIWVPNHYIANSVKNPNCHDSEAVWKKNNQLLRHFNISTGPQVIKCLHTLVILNETQSVTWVNVEPGWMFPQFLSVQLFYDEISQTSKTIGSSLRYFIVNYGHSHSLTNPTSHYLYCCIYSLIDVTSIALKSFDRQYGRGHAQAWFPQNLSCHFFPQKESFKIMRDAYNCKTFSA